MKKVCFLSAAHVNLDIRIFYKEAKTLVCNGYDVTMVMNYGANVEIEGVKIVNLNIPKNRASRFILGSIKIIHHALKINADVYHLCDASLILAGLILKVIFKKIIIYDVMEDFPQKMLVKQWIPNALKRPISVIYDAIEKWAANMFDYVIVAHYDILEKFKHKNIISVENYPILDYFKKTRNYNAQKNTYKILYVGGLTKIRGILEIAMSMKYINPKYNVRLQLIGEFCDKNFENHIIKIIKDDNRIEVIKWMPFEEMVNFLYEADIGLLCLWIVPGHIQLGVNKLYEYMAAGLPIIATDIPIWKEFIEQNQYGLCVNINDPRNIANAIERLIEHPEEAKIMGRNGRKAVEEKYNWEKEATKLLAIYKTLLQ